LEKNKKNVAQENIEKKTGRQREIKRGKTTRNRVHDTAKKEINVTPYATKATAGVIPWMGHRM
jgi:hypothetical protein